MAKKYYVVKKGRTPGIYESWDECKKQIDKFSGAEYKGFTSRLEAEEYYGIIDNNDDAIQLMRDMNEFIEEECNSRLKMKLKKYNSIFYTDGSYNSNNNCYGAAFVESDLEGNIISKHYEGEKDISGMRNVTGEIIAVLRVIEYSLKNNYNNILICYDYEGIENWCNGEWKANKTLSQYLKSTFNLYSKIINIDFEHIKAHSGNELNDTADYLAKKGAGIDD